MKKNWKYKTGIILIIISSILFCSLLAIPFLNAENKLKIIISTSLIVLGEITFWIGSIFIGKELYNKYKAQLNPLKWFRKKIESDKTHNESKNSS